MKTTISPVTRLLVLISVLLLPIALFLPVWQIELWAPQYPEGLVLKIWLNKLSGDVDVINGLNHYIGMAHIKEEMFPEFTYMPYILLFFILFGLLTALLRKRPFLIAYFSMLILAGIAALIDFWKWAYEYGHNLDPNAAIIVPGMAYQPPIIGYKALLNFGAYSIPDWGGWAIIVAGVLVGLALAYDLWLIRKNNIIKGVATLTVLSLIWSCQPSSTPIQYGQDLCEHCRMTILDKRFAAELVNKNSKAFKFDDMFCMLAYLKETKTKLEKYALVLVNDFNQPGRLIDAQQADFYQLTTIRSPMRGDLAAFVSKPDSSGIGSLVEAQSPFRLISLLP